MQPLDDAPSVYDASNSGSSVQVALQGSIQDVWSLRLMCLLFIVHIKDVPLSGIQKICIDPHRGTNNDPDYVPAQRTFKPIRQAKPETNQTRATRSLKLLVCGVSGIQRVQVLLACEFSGDHSTQMQLVALSNSGAVGALRSSSQWNAMN